MASRSEKMYGDSPKMERKDDGKLAVKKSEKKVAKESSGTADMATHEEGLPAAARHASERRDMYNRHETEHSVMDSGSGSSKKEMAGRHVKELTDMHKRHESELSGSGKEKINK